MFSVKCAEAVWNYKSGRRSALLINHLHLLFFSLPF